MAFVVGGVPDEDARHVAEVIQHGSSGSFRIQGFYVFVLGRQPAERHQFLVAALLPELDEDGVLYHRVVHDPAFPVVERAL
jgi:hypothetical protein